MANIYHVEYKHPNGDFYKSPGVTLESLSAQLNRPVTEEEFLNTTKQLFKTRKAVRESNIKVFRNETVIYEQKVF